MRLAAVVLVALTAACTRTVEPGTRTAIVSFRGTDWMLRVEVADSVAEQRRGLMQRTTIPPNGGMVFTYDEPVRHGFVMRDTIIPLSIAFWDEGGTIVDILDMSPCRAEPCPTYEPRAAYVAAVETDRGWFAEHGISVGDRVRMEVA